MGSLKSAKRKHISKRLFENFLTVPAKSLVGFRVVDGVVMRVSYAIKTYVI